MIVSIWPTDYSPGRVVITLTEKSNDTGSNLVQDNVFMCQHVVTLSTPTEYNCSFLLTTLVHNAPWCPIKVAIITAIIAVYWRTAIDTNSFDVVHQSFMATCRPFTDDSSLHNRDCLINHHVPLWTTLKLSFTHFFCVLFTLHFHINHVAVFLEKESISK
jgi:hypothetical protein